MSGSNFLKKCTFKNHGTKSEIKNTGETMNFKYLSNENLVETLTEFVRDERKMTSQIIKCINEIDRRKLYLEKGYSSLFDFLTKQMGYSPGSAMRRIDAARLLNEIPETLKKIEEGSLTLAQVTQVQRATRDLYKSKKETLSPMQKRKLFCDLENKSQKESEKLIAQTLDIPVPEIQKEKVHRDQSVTLTITFTQEQMEILQQAQNMISHAVVNKDWAEAMTYLAKREVKRRTSVKQQNSRGHFEGAAVNAVAEVNTTKRPALPAAIRKTLLHRTARCMHKDASGNICGSHRFLQIDHIKSWSRGGTHAPENLQVLCGAHNRWKYTSQRGE
jgi:tRNA isopentenyl-2-thiomethyl-A-37 hydroxylase MiaE